MELTNSFVVDRPIDETWRILNDLEFIAPCMPGAQLQEIEGDEYRGLVKIKVGPITANYKGKASFVSQDEAAKVAKLKAEGRDPRQGNANAMVTASMEAQGADATEVTIHTDLSLSGKIASFGRGAIEDVSKKLLGQFVDNLRDKLATEGEAPAGDAAPTETAAAPAAAAAAPAAASEAVADAPAVTPEAPKVRKIEGPEAEPVDLLDVGGDAMAKRLAPVLAAIIGLIILRLVLRRRGDA